MASMGRHLPGGGDSQGADRWVRLSRDNDRAIADFNEAISWRASLTRKRGQVLGNVETPSRAAAEAAAVRELGLSPKQRSRLVVQERG
jgi:hypothetical protein